MKKLALFLLAAAVALPALAAPPVVTITGKLANRVCTVEDVFLLQPADQHRCTLTFAAQDSLGNTLYWTVYCPNKAADGQGVNLAYPVCSNPAGMQINHPTATYTVTGWLRTIPQQADGFGQVQGYSFGY